MSYERDEAARQQDATEAMIRMRDPRPRHPHPEPIPMQATRRLLTDVERGLISLALTVASGHWREVAREVHPQNPGVQALVDTLIGQAAQATDLAALFSAADAVEVETVPDPADEAG